MQFEKVITEGLNVASAEIDHISTLEMYRIINDEDKTIPLVVEHVLPDIAATIDVIRTQVGGGGRLIYLGTGTSGRPRILDASKCPPTYGAKPDLVVGLTADGEYAIQHAVGDVEDSRGGGVNDLKNTGLTVQDVVIGIAASGCTPYVIAGLEYACQLGCCTVDISYSPGSVVSSTVESVIMPVVGTGVATGSSRMKAGTAQKLALNIFSTRLMIKSGKVFGNLTINAVTTSEKLYVRQVNIIKNTTGCNAERVGTALIAYERNCKTAIVMVLKNLGADEAKKCLDRYSGLIRKALEKRQPMTKETSSELLNTIFTRAGGPGDIASCGSYMTRLRLGVHDSSLIDPDIKTLEDMKGVTLTSDQVQVVFGPGKVHRAAKTTSELLGEAPAQDAAEIAVQNKRQLKARQTSGVQQFLAKFATILTPLIPGFIAAGLLLGITTLIVMMIHVTADAQGTLPDALSFMKAFSKGLFTFLVTPVGYNAAQASDGTGVNGATITALFLFGYSLTAITGYYAGFHDSFGLPINPRGNTTGVLIAAWARTRTKCIVHRSMPDDLDMLLTLLIALLITATLVYSIIMLLGDWLFEGTLWLFMHLNSNPLGCAVLVGLFLITAVFGVHQGFILVYLASMNSQGFNSLLPILLMTGAGQVGMTLALYWQVQPHSVLCSQVRRAIIPDLLGVDEPLIYGVTLPRMKPFVTACLGGAASGLPIGLIVWWDLPMGLNNAFGPPGPVVLPLMTFAQSTLPAMAVHVGGILVAWVNGFTFATLFSCHNINLD